MNDKQRANVQRLRDYYAAMDRIPDWGYDNCAAAVLANLDIIVDRYQDNEVAAALGLSRLDTESLIGGMGHYAWHSYSDDEIKGIVLAVFDGILAGKPVEWPRP